MSGTKTYRFRGGHPTARHEWVGAPVTADWKAAGAALGRELTAAECAALADILARHRSLIADLQLWRVTRADCLATLQGLARGDLNRPGRTLHAVDETTRALVTFALHANGERSAAALADPAPDAVQRAAALVLQALDESEAAALDPTFVQGVGKMMPPQAGGRPDSPLVPLLRELLDAWRGLGGAAPTFATGGVRKDGTRSAPAVVRFVAALLPAIGADLDLSQSQIGKLLEKAAGTLPPGRFPPD